LQIYAILFQSSKHFVTHSYVINIVYIDNKLLTPERLTFIIFYNIGNRARNIGRRFRIIGSRQASRGDIVVAGPSSKTLIAIRSTPSSSPTRRSGQFDNSAPFSFQSLPHPPFFPLKSFLSIKNRVKLFLFIKTRLFLSPNSVPFLLFI
jgi:hypothetical protein